MPLDTNALFTALAAVKLLVTDVDGVLTDGGVYYDDAGRETKRFHIHDGLGIVLAGFANLPVVWITGRTSPVVERRARELKVAYLAQGVRDKVVVLRDVAARFGVTPREVAYIGDDLNDLPALRFVGVALTPQNAATEVAQAAHWTIPREGGQGVVRYAIESILRARGDYDVALAAYLTSLGELASNPVQ